jgi:hypothetical protein
MMRAMSDEPRSSTGRRVVHVAARVLGVIALLFAIVTVRVLVSSRSAFVDAERAPSHDERRFLLGIAARMYAPGNPWSARAYAALVEEAQLTEAVEPKRALAAWREVRSAILATRSFYTPNRPLLDEANAAIARLTAAVEGSGPAGTAWHATRLAEAEREAPSVGWSVVALTGLFLWLGAAAALFLVGFDANDAIRRRPALAAACGVALGLTLFFVGLARA